MRVFVTADGGSRGNPGPASFGAVLWSADTGLIIGRSSGYIGEATNNVAEYRGVIAGLELARDRGATEVRVCLDSRLVVEQMKGAWRVLNPGLQPLHERASRVAAELGAVTFEWIPRKRNSEADALCNMELDRA